MGGDISSIHDVIEPPPRIRQKKAAKLGINLGHQSKKNDVYFALEAIVGILVFFFFNFMDIFIFWLGLRYLGVQPTIN